MIYIVKLTLLVNFVEVIVHFINSQYTHSTSAKIVIFTPVSMVLFPLGRVVMNTVIIGFLQS